MAAKKRQTFSDIVFGGTYPVAEYIGKRQLKRSEF